MQSGELIVARVKGEARVLRLVEAAEQGARVKVYIGGNRPSSLPAERVMLDTGIVTAGNDQAAEVRDECDSLAAVIDLEEVWDVVRDEGSPMTLDDLAKLYWGASPSAVQRIALLLHMDRDGLHFAEEQGGYAPRSPQSVEETRDRRRRRVENARDTATLIEHLSRGSLPSAITGHQTGLLGHLRGYAVHGDSYTKRAEVQGLLKDAAAGSGDLQRAAFELLVAANVISADEPLELERAGVVEDFSAEAMADVPSIGVVSDATEPRRTDLTAVPTVTIDDADTLDRDDALSLEIEAKDGGGPAIYRVGVHITDVGALIASDGALDKEAYRRMTTIYLPDRRVPMLPPEVSHGLGSLVAGESRAALSVLTRFTEGGEVLDWEVTPAMVESSAALNYDEADRAIEGPEKDWGQMLAALDRVAQSLYSRRLMAGAVSIDRPEMAVKIDESGDVNVTILSRTSRSRRMVAELMIHCNSVLAEFSRAKGFPMAFRSQGRPDLDDLQGVPEGPLRNYLAARRFPPAALSVVPAAHGGLGVPAYIQATSPLRRYPDLVMQRQIGSYLASGRPMYSSEEVISVAGRADVRLRELAGLEEERKRYWFLKYLGRDGARPLDVVVLDNQPGRNALVELAEYPFRQRASIPTSYAPGDTVTLRLHSVDLWRRVAHLVYEG